MEIIYVGDIASTMNVYVHMNTCMYMYRLLDYVRSLKSVKYVERNQRFQLNLEKGQQLNDLIFEKSTDTVHPSACAAQNLYPWVGC